MKKSFSIFTSMEVTQSMPAYPAYQGTMMALTMKSLFSLFKVLEDNPLLTGLKPYF